ncbi:MAG: type II toxin-antitoxin system RelE/ParE family toxin [Atopobiaceae bacterium]|nr:type II toxin-antitoxin system RelE/ParE family toxin [Atopobiaceae bacterium]
MPAEAVWSPMAVADLDAIWEWIAVENGEPSSADRTVGAIVDRMDEVATFPLASAPLDSVCRIRSDWRSGGYVFAHADDTWDVYLLQRLGPDAASSELASQATDD